jgi:pimeloyl-ACP methyl ester carboxylesterase
LSRAVWLILGVLLAVPAILAGGSALVSTAFIAEFLTEGRWRPLSVITPGIEPRRLPAAVGERAIDVDLYPAPRIRGRASGLVLVHGLSARGKDDPRVRQAASLLARAGWTVAVPTVTGLTVLRLRPDDAAIVVSAAHALNATGYRPIAILAVSLGAGPALLGASDPTLGGSISAVLALGGYASAVELLRYTLTGAYGFDGQGGRRPVNEPAIAQFARANADLVDSPGHRLVDNRDPRAIDDLVAALPVNTRRLLAALSPEGAVGRLHAPLFLIHGRDDPAVPFTESLRLDRAARAAGRPVTTVIVGSLGHVEPELRAGPFDLFRLWTVFYAFRSASGLTSAAGGS